LGSEHDFTPKERSESSKDALEGLRYVTHVECIDEEPGVADLSSGAAAQVAAELFLGVSTVKTHTQRLYEKLGVSDRAAAVAVAMRQGLVE